MNTKALAVVVTLAIAGIGTFFATRDKQVTKEPVAEKPSAAPSSAAKKPAEPPVAAPKPNPPAVDPGAPSANTLLVREQIEGIGKKAEYSEAAEKRLIEALKHEDQDVRGHACWGLGRMAPKTSKAVPDLVTALGDPVWAVQHNAAWALKKFGKDAFPGLLEAAKSEDPRRASRAAGTLLGMGYEQQEELEKALHRGAAVKGDPHAVLASLSAMGSLKQPQKETLDLLIAQLGNPDASFVKACAVAVGRIDKSAAPAIPAMLKAAEHKDKRVRLVVAESLGQMGVPDPKAIALLSQLLGDKKDRPALGAASALSKLDAVDALAEAMKSKSSRKRRFAIESLRSVEKLTARRVSLIVQGMSDKDWQVRLTAAAALHRRKGTEAHAATGALAKLLKDDNEVVSGQAAAVLQGFETPAARKALKG